MSRTYKNHVIAFCIILFGLVIGGTVFFIHRDNLEDKAEKIFAITEKIDTYIAPPSGVEFYTATSTRLGISMLLQKGTLAVGARGLQMIDDGISDFVEIGIIKKHQDARGNHRMRIYTFPAKTEKELEINTIRFAGKGDSGEYCLFQKTTTGEYDLIDPKTPMTTLDGRTFPTPCFAFNFHKIVWQEKAKKAYMIPLGNDAPFFDNTIWDGYMIQSIALF